MKLSKFKSILDYVCLFTNSIALAIAVGTVAFFIPYTNADSLLKTVFIFLIISTILTMIVFVVHPYITNQLLKNILKYVSLSTSLIVTVLYYVFAAKTYAILFAVAAVLTLVFIALAVYEIMLVYSLVKNAQPHQTTTKTAKAVYNEEVIQVPAEEPLFAPDTLNRKKRILFNTAAILGLVAFATVFIINLVSTIVSFNGVAFNEIFNDHIACVAFIVCVINLLLTLFGTVLNATKISRNIKKYNKASVVSCITFNFAFVWLTFMIYVVASLLVNPIVCAFEALNLVTSALMVVASAILYLVGLLIKGNSKKEVYVSDLYKASGDLKSLKTMLEQSLITQTEYNTLKKKILESTKF